MGEKRDWIEWAVKIFNKGVEDDLFTGQIGLLEKPSNWQPIKAILSDRSSYEPPKLNLNKLKSECSYDSKQYALVGKKCPEGLNNRYDSFDLVK